MLECGTCTVHVHAWTCVCAHVCVTHLHPWRTSECWTNGLINTCLTVENGTHALSREHHRVVHLASLMLHVSPAIQRPSQARGWGVPARVRPFQPGLGRRPAENELLPIPGRSGRQGPHRTNESVDISLADPPIQAVSIVSLKPSSPPPCPAERGDSGKTGPCGSACLTWAGVPSFQKRGTF